jgi:hypothetical protein
MRQVTYEKSTRSVNTLGLTRSGQDDTQVEVNRSELLPYAEQFLRHVVSYLRESGRRILPGETFPYGYWLVRFEARDGRLEVWEYNPAATEFVRGACLTLTYWRDQHQICDQLQAAFVPPRPDRLTVVDNGVFEGLPIQAVRYPSPEHMSGWWITTDKYNGDVSTLRREHTYHVTSTRPDIAPYIALPYGFRFDLGESGAHAWLDERVAGQSPNV